MRGGRGGGGDKLQSRANTLCLSLEAKEERCVDGQAAAMPLLKHGSHDHMSYCEVRGANPQRGISPRKRTGALHFSVAHVSGAVWQRLVHLQPLFLRV